MTHSVESLDPTTELEARLKFLANALGFTLTFFEVDGDDKVTHSVDYSVSRIQQGTRQEWSLSFMPSTQNTAAEKYMPEVPNEGNSAPDFEAYPADIFGGLTLFAYWLEDEKRKAKCRKISPRV
jgi:hypothetical protein